MINKFLSLLLTLQLTAGPLAQVLPVRQSAAEPKTEPTKASAQADQIQQALQDRTQSAIKNLDIDLIMLGPDFAGTAPGEVSWAGDNSKLWFRWKRPGERESGIFEREALPAG